MQNDKKSAAIQLLIWGVFFLLIIILSKSYKKTPNENTNKDNTNSNIQMSNDLSSEEDEYLKIKNTLLTYNYEFYFIITSSEETIIYSGKQNQEEVLGYKETSNNIEKFYINEDKIYKVVGENEEYLYSLEEIQTDITYLDINSIIDIIDNLDYTIEDENLIYNLGDYSISLSTFNGQEEIINIKKGDLIYNLKYYNINQVNEL